MQLSSACILPTAVDKRVSISKTVSAETGLCCVLNKIANVFWKSLRFVILQLKIRNGCLARQYW